MLEFFKSERFYLPVIYVVFGIIFYILVSKAITNVSKINIKYGGKGIDKRKNTVIALIKNIIKYVVAIIVIILVLGVYGVNTTSLIASLGAVSLIIGLAFQDIIKDFLAGVFLIFDNAYAVGDVVEINGFKGEVISLGLKTTKILSYTGEVKVLSNSCFQEVINYSLNPSKMVIYVPVGYDVEIEKIENILNKVKKEIEKDENVLSMDLLGVDDFKDSYVSYAVVIECNAMTHYGAKRKLLGLIKSNFDKEGIVIPYNQLDVHIDK